MTPYANWVRTGDNGSTNTTCWHLLVGRSANRYCAAQVWSNGVWHTWDKNGCGGENASEPTVERAKTEATASAIAQGFI